MNRNGIAVECSALLAALTMRPQEALSVEVNQMSGRVSNPHFGFPTDIPQISRHRLPIRESGYIHNPRSTFRKQR